MGGNFCHCLSWVAPYESNQARNQKRATLPFQIMKNQTQFLRQQVSGGNMMLLICAGCGHSIAYSARPEVLAAVENAHARNCPGLVPAFEAPRETITFAQ